ncbi:unnamed protein product [Urochloa humidicola]
MMPSLLAEAHLQKHQRNRKRGRSAPGDGKRREIDGKRAGEANLTIFTPRRNFSKSLRKPEQSFCVLLSATLMEQSTWLCLDPWRRRRCHRPSKPETTRRRQQTYTMGTREVW